MENQLQVEQYVTAKELSEIIGVTERTVKDTAKSKGMEGTFHPLNTNGGVQNVMCYSQEQATEIKKEIQKHHNLTTRKIDGVTTEQEENETIVSAMVILQRRANEYKKRAEVAESNLAVAQPKVEFYDAVASSNDTMYMRDVAKILALPFGGNKLFKILRDRKILQSDNTPYQAYVDRGYFRVKETENIDSNGNVHVNKTTLVYQKGVDYIRKLMQEAF